MFQALYAAGSKRNIDLKIAQNWPSKQFPNVDTEYLVKKEAAQVCTKIKYYKYKKTN